MSTQNNRFFPDGEREPPEMFDPEVNELELAERAEANEAALDAAFDQGYEAYGTLGAQRDDARHWEVPKLIQAWQNGWDMAATEEAARGNPTA